MVTEMQLRGQLQGAVWCGQKQVTTKRSPRHLDNALRKAYYSFLIHCKEEGGRLKTSGNLCFIDLSLF
jgi:hypothetical protein